VWLSEIMLQQTQVATVKAYFARFVDRFPDVAALAAASLDDVLGLWSGLGYYSRARNLHRCAQELMRQHDGKFPRDAETLATLPGIGRSTAAAIASLCFTERVAILDANVKRVVSRVTGFEADVAVAANARALWDAATGLLPSEKRATQDMARYTQGMMDLGAMVCTPKRPACVECPVQKDCRANAAGDPESYPVRSRKLRRSSQSIWLLWAETVTGDVWLGRRPTPGVWAGLYCLPLFESESTLLDALPAYARGMVQMAPAFLHVLTHKDLHLHVCRVRMSDRDLDAETIGEGRWIGATEWPALGLPAPIRKLLERR